MNPFDDYEHQLATMQSEMDAAQAASETLQQQSIKSMEIARRYLLELKERLVSVQLSEEAEIYFFKQVKPRFYSPLIYYYKILQWELEKPTGGKKLLRKYWQTQLVKLYYFFRKYHFLYHYYRSGATYLDAKLFLRNTPQSLPGVATYQIDIDPSFTTGYDFILARMLANERLQVYLETKLREVEGVERWTETKVNAIAWTGSKASLIELVYALQSTGVLNHGRAALSEIAQWMERIFGVQLGNYYRVFQEIRIRKKSRTQFLDELKDRLIQKMDYDDEHPHLKE